MRGDSWVCVLYFGARVYVVFDFEFFGFMFDFEFFGIVFNFEFFFVQILNFFREKKT